MKLRFALVVALATVTAPAWAGDLSIESLANQTGVSERHVRMIVGCRTCFAEYVYTYDRELKRFKAGLGDGNYERLMSGQPVLLRDGTEVKIRVASR